MLNLLLNYVVCGRHFEFMVKNMFKVKLNVRNGIPMPELITIDLLLVKIATQMKNHARPEPMATILENGERGVGAHF